MSFLSVSLIVWVAVIQLVNCQDLDPCITEFNITQYLGRWYQTHTNLIPYLTYASGTCGTATYSAYDLDTITVYNSQNLDVPGGPEDSLAGFAYVRDDVVCLLNLTFPSLDLYGTYYIMALGPVVDGLYDYSLVSDKDLISLFVLARDIGRFQEEYEEYVLEQLTELGFTGTRQPIVTEHTDECNYPPIPGQVKEVEIF